MHRLLATISPMKSHVVCRTDKPHNQTKLWNFPASSLHMTWFWHKSTSLCLKPHKTSRARLCRTSADDVRPLKSNASVVAQLGGVASRRHPNRSLPRLSSNKKGWFWEEPDASRVLTLVSYWSSPVEGSLFWSCRDILRGFLWFATSVVKWEPL